LAITGASIALFQTIIYYHNLIIITLLSAFIGLCLQINETISIILATSALVPVFYTFFAIITAIIAPGKLIISRISDVTKLSSRAAREAFILNMSLEFGYWFIIVTS